MIECPFSLKGEMKILENEHGAETEVWELTVRNSFHSHSISQSSLIAHPYARRLSEETKLAIESLAKAGTKSKHIVRFVKKSHNLVIARDIYNQSRSLKLKALRGRTPINALLEELEEENWYFDFKVDVDGHVEYLFMARHESISLARTYPSVLVLDCTYKTNKFKMPLMDVIGISSTNQSFFVAFGFMKGMYAKNLIFFYTFISEI